MATIVFVLTFASALGAALMGGFFYAFSGLVMPSLSRRPPPEAIASMQTINVVVLNPLFFVLFFGPAALGVALSALAPFVLPAGQATAAFVASLLYAVGSIGVTIAKNIPLNDELAAASPESGEGAAVWSRYLRAWTWWNHARATACVLSAALFVLAL